MPRRRSSDPQATQRLWDAIKITRYQRQIPDLDRIARYMARLHNVSREDVADQLDLCVKDGLILLKNKVGARGSKIGVKQKGYFLPNRPANRDDYDWYCFVCHTSGEVICCTSCWRVYHPTCLPSEDVPEDSEQTFVCKVCKECVIGKDSVESKVKKKDLNRLLGYTCQLLAGLCPVSLMTREVPSSGLYIAYLNSLSAEAGAEPQPETAGRGMVTDQDDEWRGEHLVYRPIDLLFIRDKAKRCVYEHTNELKADVETLVHNMIIYHGADHEITTSARKMLEDCTYDLNEIRQCPDCYRMSNEQSDRWWFCEPCATPHELVFAKQGSYPYWPAKVIRLVDGDLYDVRFFGGPHQRAVIPAAFIRPITASLDSLHIKHRTASWNKAYQELNVHQDKLKQKKPDNVYDFNSSDEEGEQPAVAERKRKASPPIQPKRTAAKKACSETGGSGPPELDDMSPPATSAAAVPQAGVSEEAMVSSSSQDMKAAVLRSKAVQTGAVKSTPNTIQLEKLRREHELATKRAVDTACADLREQLEEAHALEIQTLKEEHATELSEVKLKQWCFNCEREAIYHCCWNTAYCSTKCQQDHWITQHKPHCRRKRV